MPEPFDAAGFLTDLEKLCVSCKKEGLDDSSIKTILSRGQVHTVALPRSLPSSAVLNDFNPLNVVIRSRGVGSAICQDVPKRGSSFHDVALFLASVEALEKYPFCNRVDHLGGAGQLSRSLWRLHGRTASCCAC